MKDALNTLFLRLEGPLQAWGDNSKFVIRRTMEAPTKSGVLGLICCAMGLSREAARDRLPKLNGLSMGVRIDRSGTRWWDYHTVGAKIGILKADGKGIKRTGGGKNDPIETLISRREYLCDASFLVALQGDAEQINSIHEALKNPRWPPFLGRKSCPPSVPVLAAPRNGETWTNPADMADLPTALAALPWRPRLEQDAPRENGQRCKKIDLECLMEWQPRDGAIAPDNAEVWYDTPESLAPPVHEARLVLRETIQVKIGGPIQQRTPPPPRPRANYQNTEYQKARKARLESDKGLCVFCKAPATTVQHVTYRRAGGDETLDDLRALCRLCHDAVTMIEYGLGMGLDRINPEDPQWRDRIDQKRKEIIKFRSLETRRRRLAAEEVE